MCSFHMTIDHDGWTFLDWINCVQLVKDALAVEQSPKNEKAKK